ncbi:MAG: DUF819 family protein [Candidatus Neomarinimicrobiota bacterium]|nr:DUF819 family protein [Candidatus Neomarinimicrobiota bacterium]
MIPLQDPMAILVYLIAIIGLIYYLNSKSEFSGLFKYLPTVIWIYFLPMFSTTLGILPESSVLYDWIKTYLLPPALILLLLSSNFPALKKLGSKAILIMFIATISVVIGGIVSFTIFASWLPYDSWKGLGALSGSWIGGSANMVAVGSSIGTPDDLFGIMIIVDTVVGYGWMGIVIFFSAYQEKIDRWNGVETSLVENINIQMSDIDSKRRPIRFIDLITILSIGMIGGYYSLKIGEWLPDLGRIVTSFGWTIIIVSILGIIFSLTPLSDLENAGASHIGNFFLYLLLATIGAKANLTSIIYAPVFLLVGICWIAVHAVILFMGGRLLKVPMFLIATSSQANIGGVVSAPIIATVYQKSLAPVGLLMGVLGNIIGIYFGLLTAWALSWISNYY